MTIIIKTDPWTRVNDSFIKDELIDLTPPEHDIKHPIIWPFDLTIDYSGNANYNIRADWYKKIALDVVTETVFCYPYPYITEKTLRAIANKRMFIILGAPGILSILHSKGFKTFNDFIDESYDTELDPKKRFFMVVNEVQKICNLPIDDIKAYLQKNVNRLDHNFLTLKNLENQELEILKERFAS
jgi:hypothetical protein